MRVKGTFQRDESLYKPEMDEIAYNILAQGDGVASVCAALNICAGTYANWLNEYSNFKSACSRGRMLGAEWWEKTGKNHLADKNFNDRLYNARVGQLYWREFKTGHVLIPKLAKAKTYTEKGDAIIEALAKGEISPDNALKASQVVMAGATLKEKTELEARLVEIEKSLGKQK